MTKCITTEGGEKVTSEERRKEVAVLLNKSVEPLTGAELASKFSVTRQIIVKDIALLKAQGLHIVSTARGYILQKEATNAWKQRVITVCHDAKEMEKELQLIVDLGGKIVDTKVEHPVYGTLGESLNIRSRKDIQIFLEKIKETGCEPLLYLTGGLHTHLIMAEDENSLDEICSALKEANYLIFP